MRYDTLIGKRVQVTFHDDSTVIGILKRGESFLPYSLADETDTSVVWHFHSANIKKIKELKA